jgi:osmotically-inducible protein OsmY
VLRIGSKARFEDRWRGAVTALEVTEEWEVVNVVVESGLLLWGDSIRLPLSAASGWDDGHVAFSATSTAAFAHEIPPVAVPSRPVGDDTPISAPGARFAGAAVSLTDRRVVEVLIAAGLSGAYRVPVSEVTFEGKTLAIGSQLESLPRYRPDERILDDIRKVIREDRGLTADDKRGLDFSVSGGVATMGGNVRVPNATERALGLVKAVPGVVSVAVETVDDLSLETAIGLALDRARLSQRVEVYARASIGSVKLWGYVPSAAVVEDIVRTAGAVPGVREVVNKLEAATGAAA